MSAAGGRGSGGSAASSGRAPRAAGAPATRRGRRRAACRPRSAARRPRRGRSRSGTPWLCSAIRGILPSGAGSYAEARDSAQNADGSRVLRPLLPGLGSDGDGRRASSPAGPASRPPSPARICAGISRSGSTRGSRLNQKRRSDGSLRDAGLMHEATEARPTGARAARRSRRGGSSPRSARSTDRTERRRRSGARPSRRSAATPESRCRGSAALLRPGRSSGPRRSAPARVHGRMKPSTCG